jgi:hypothetical protein
MKDAHSSAFALVGKYLEVVLKRSLTTVSFFSLVEKNGQGQTSDATAGYQHFGLAQGFDFLESKGKVGLKDRLVVKNGLMIRMGHKSTRGSRGRYSLNVTGAESKRWRRGSKGCEMGQLAF